ncbi:MAG TPA: tryptophan--tRNA ligase [Candidatus Nitrosopolaris sp.]|nr:tryptophan--tRNA ligase [Candidatus Nitrosopolaris sp.]
MAKEVILTGIRSNKDLHIGNYFGALLPMIDMAKQHSGEYQINLFVPDLHSFTTPIDHDQLQAQTMHNLKIFVAAGLPLDNPGIHIYRQSYIPAHSEMTWILDCFTGFGEMSRMTQFKDKAASLLMKGSSVTPPVKNINGEFKFDEKQAQKNDELRRDRVSVGLFNYPVLMAADILLYGAKYVPVGDDQTQHLEFTRDIAERMNKQFGDLFIVPEPVAKQHEFFGKDQGLRIKDLADPAKKMSKSEDSDKGVIFMGDDPEAAAQKIMSATTDSYNRLPSDDEERKKQPGITNLMLIKVLLTGNLNLPESNTQGYAYLKEQVANDVKAFLSDFQAKMAQVDEEAIQQKLTADEAKMTEVANKTLLKVQQAVGLRPNS